MTNFVLFSLVTIAVAGVTVAASTDNNCLDVTTVDDFDLTSYASKPWYVQQQAENTYTPRDMDRCVKAEYNLREEPNFWGYTVDVYNSAENSSSGRTTGGALCADYKEDNKSELMVAPCWLPKWFAGPYWVVAYDDDAVNGYALVSGGQPKDQVDDDTTCGANGNEQCCKTGTGINNSGLWILTRQPTPSTDLVDSVREIARQKGFSTTSDVLFDVDHTGCGYDSDDTAASLTLTGKRRLLRSSGN